MTDDHVPLPGEVPPSKTEEEEPPEPQQDQGDDRGDEDSAEQSDPTVQSVEEQTSLANVVQASEEGSEPLPEPEPVPEQEQEEQGGWAAFEDDFPKDHSDIFAKVPISSVPRVVEVEVKESAKPDVQKSSLEIDEGPEKSRISLGESNESPVTPEELDVQNLAKLESLKESDA